jgi:hypothetical protein
MVNDFWLTLFGGGGIDDMCYLLVGILLLHSYCLFVCLFDGV